MVNCHNHIPYRVASSYYSLLDFLLDFLLYLRPFGRSSSDTQVVRETRNIVQTQKWPLAIRWLVRWLFSWLVSLLSITQHTKFFGRQKQWLLCFAIKNGTYFSNWTKRARPEVSMISLCLENLFDQQRERKLITLEVVMGNAGKKVEIPKQS